MHRMCCQGFSAWLDHVSSVVSSKMHGLFISMRRQCREMCSCWKGHLMALRVTANKALAWCLALQSYLGLLNIEKESNTETPASGDNYLWKLCLVYCLLGLPSLPVSPVFPGTGLPLHPSPLSTEPFKGKMWFCENISLFHLITLP